NVADFNSGTIIITIAQDFGNHNGGHIEFGADGYLYIGMGDGGSGGDPNNRAQSPTSLLGKMLRLDIDGGTPYAIPAGNAADFDNTWSAIPEAWAIGLRNPWKFNFDPVSNDLWIADVGQNALEEINYVANGTGEALNFGWRCYEGNSAFNTSGCNGQSSYEAALSDYSHGNPYFFCSITGGVVYRGSSYPNMSGHYFFTDYCAGDIFTLSPDGNGGFDETLVNSALGFGNVAMGYDQNNEVYLATLGGTIYRLVDANADFAPFISASGSDLVTSEGSAFFWYLNGELIDGANGASYTPTEDGVYSAVVENNEGYAVETNSINWMIISGPAGCTYMESPEYDPQAVIDDGSCIFLAPETCPSDINGDNIINAADLLALLGAFGSFCE
ncbi:MAG: PQQ-dependent sugar dehydrogenase, partial [Bacteroidota bacterium]